MKEKMRRSPRRASEQLRKRRRREQARRRGERLFDEIDNGNLVQVKLEAKEGGAFRVVIGVFTKSRKGDKRGLFFLSGRQFNYRHVISVTRLSRRGS